MTEKELIDSQSQCRYKHGFHQLCCSCELTFLAFGSGISLGIESYPLNKKIQISDDPKQIDKTYRNLTHTL